MSTVLFLASIAIGVVVLIVLLRWDSQERKDNLLEDTRKARARRRVGDDEEAQWL